ncbi:MAG: hypothetical protein Q9227_007574 [Pyrenula ochraceoflavens]
MSVEHADDGGNTMQKCSDYQFCCFGGTCDCQSGFNVTTFTADNHAITTIGISAATTTSLSSSTSSTASQSSLASQSSRESTSSFTSSTTAEPANPSSTPPGSSSHFTATKIAVAVAVPSAALVVLLAAIFYVRHTRLKRRMAALSLEPLRINTARNGIRPLAQNAKKDEREDEQGLVPLVDLKAAARNRMTMSSSIEALSAGESRSSGVYEGGGGGGEGGSMVHEIPGDTVYRGTGRRM